MKLLGLCQTGGLPVAEACWCNSSRAVGVIPRPHLQIERAGSLGGGSFTLARSLMEDMVSIDL